MASLSLRHIYKIYSGGVKAVSDFNLEIDDKEFIVFVGPSGCGKSTTLRMIAGLEEISMGELYIDGRLVNDVEPKDRDIAMVFQNYALYPHMTVFDNMAFGLKLRKMPMTEITARVNEAAKTLSITQLLSRKPKALSGGQRQRVALGRAIVREPKVFLLDEPLSNLDAKLRVQMRTEITKLHNRLATTFVYVTHDQTEAMTMGTRIVVMKDGLMQQVDTPQNLYDNPCNQFVASFIGTPQMNFIKAMLTKEGKHLCVQFGKNKIQLSESKSKKLLDESFIGKEVIFGVRPEDIHDEEIFIEASPKTCFTAEVDVMEKLGNETILYTKIDGKEEYCIARVDARTKVIGGETVNLAIDGNHVHLFDPETELSLLGLPQYNYFEGKLTSEKNSLIAEIEKNKINLGEGSVGRLTNSDLIGGRIIVGINPTMVSFGGDGDIKIGGVVEFVEDTGAYKIVYIKAEGKKALMAVKAASDCALKAGEAVKMIVDVKGVQLFDAETSMRVISYGNVPKLNLFDTTAVENTAKTGEKTVTVSFNGSSIKLNRSLKGAAADAKVAINPSSVVYTKEEMAGKHAFKVTVSNYDKIGNNTLVFGTLANGSPFVAKVDSKFTCAEGEKVKFAVDVSAVDVVNSKGESILA